MAQWKILGVESADGELITKAKYHASEAYKGHVVETEGFWAFENPKLNAPFASVTEDMIIDWIKAETTRDGANLIEQRLKEQLDAMKTQRITLLPWLPQTITPKFED